MKRLVYASLAMAAFMCFLSVNGAAGMDGPRLEMRETTFDFKEALEGEKVSHDFMIRNTGGEVLNILGVKVD